MDRWYVRSGRSGAWTYARVTHGSVILVPDLSEATRFETKAEAAMVQADLVAELGIAVACLSEQQASRVGPGPDRPEVHADPEASDWVREVMGLAKAMCADEGKAWDEISGLDRDRFGRAAAAEVVRRQEAGVVSAG